MEDNSRATISVVAVACLLFGLTSVALAFPFFWKQYEVVRTWPAATASIRSSDVVQITQGGQQLWATRFEFSFDVNGRIVMATVNGYRSGSLKERVQAAANRYPAGSQRLIRYDPKNPQEVRLDTDQPRRYYQLPIALSITGTIFVLMAVGLFYVAKRVH